MAVPLVLKDPLNPNLPVIAIGTVNQRNPVMQNIYVRPINAWAPHYEEDLSFQACAPQASPNNDPPLHFAKDPTTGNVSWCAEVYPSQNDNVPSLDQLNNPNAPMSATNTYIGHVRPFTSHIAKNSASADCQATVPASIPQPAPNGAQYYPLVSAAAQSNPAACADANSSTIPQGVARHPADAIVDYKTHWPPGAGPWKGVQATPLPMCANNTCDRTAIMSGGGGWTQFPLIATAPQVEQAISSDSTYGCVMTYDSGGPKTGKLTPSAGCCGASVYLTTGPIPAPTVNASSISQLNTTAHLEPDVPCLTPSY